MSVPFLDVAAGHRELRAELDAAYERVMASGQFILGPELEAFEREFAQLAGTTHAIGVGNGLDALVVGLRALGVGPGDEVVVPAHTFIATWLAVARCGARVVPVDVDVDTLLLGAEAVGPALTGRTRAVIPVHLYGRPVEMAPLARLAEDAGIAVLEDAAQAHGAQLDGVPAGALGAAAAFSFYPGKNLGALGDGGALTTSDADVAARARRLRNYGSRTRYVHDEIGDNTRLDPLQAAFLRVKLVALERWNERRGQIATRYLRELAGVPGLTLPPPTRRGMRHAWHLFCVRHRERDALREHLATTGIATQVHYPVALHRSGAFAGLGLAAGRFPVTEAAVDELLSLPMGPHLDDDSVERVVAAVRAFEPQVSFSK